MLTDVANELCDRAALDEEECFIDATFVMAKAAVRMSEPQSARERHENLGDCAPRQPNRAAHPRSATTKPLHAALAGRALVRLDTLAASYPRLLGVPPQNFLGFVHFARRVVLFRRF
jgi:hypothetical protein